MKVRDPGHTYYLEVYDWKEGTMLPLTFMKREGPGYPGNVGHYPGTNCQEVLRALINRVEYLDRQVGSNENTLILANLRSALLLFEMRAARRHGRELPELPYHIELIVPDPTDGHIK